MMDQVLLNDGRAVAHDSPEWLDECAARERHIANLNGLAKRHDRPGFEAYLANLRTGEGERAVLSVVRLRQYRLDTAKLEREKEQRR